MISVPPTAHDVPDLKFRTYSHVHDVCTRLLCLSMRKPARRGARLVTVRTVSYRHSISRCRRREATIMHRHALPSVANEQQLAASLTNLIPFATEMATTHIYPLTFDAISREHRHESREVVCYPTTEMATVSGSHTTLFGVVRRPIAPYPFLHKAMRMASLSCS